MSAETICPHCKKIVKYINHNRSNTVVCAEPREIGGITESGRLVSMYPIHTCKSEENAKDVPNLTPGGEI